MKAIGNFILGVVGILLVFSMLGGGLLLEAASRSTWAEIVEGIGWVTIFVFVVWVLTKLEKM